ncbi:MAG TPA: DUF2065 domain-containing protein [Hyphomonas sp.]|nr:DUF2065 domain-containing protein [Hyphomonas sp.]MCA8905982.1 DUF2065 domain-containing protein [Hyphomonas sp.]MCB9961064.1 DUF2065 domain-containing protein [Hyphomonas sp.]MCB9970355.1 DUF2065 domain-containing protein [Hyphomonas sp.]HPE48514.1 DUF2065 domain-containing protein [Hyphomonas sp.]
MNPVVLLLAGFGMWLFLEGAVYAIAPDAMRRMAVMLAQLSTRELTMAGLIGAAIGAGIVWVAVQLA